jgi:Tfp pilus assembly protein PilE
MHHGLKHRNVQLDTDSLEFIIIYYLNFIKRTRITTNKTHLHDKMLIFRRFLPSNHINFALQDIQHKCLSIIMIHTLLIKTGRITSKRSRYILKAPAPVHTTNLLSATRLISARHGSPCRDLP